MCGDHVLDLFEYEVGAVLGHVVGAVLGRDECSVRAAADERGGCVAPALGVFGGSVEGVFSETITVAGTASGQATVWKALFVATKLSAVEMSWRFRGLSGSFLAASTWGWAKATRRAISSSVKSGGRLASTRTAPESMPGLSLAK